jgi:hypothetical protein
VIVQKRPSRLLILPFLLPTIAGCAGTQPVAYTGISSASMLRSNPKDDGHIPLVYAAPGVDLGRYSTAVIDPVAIYNGPDQQFGDTSLEDKKAIADYAQQQFAKKVASRFKIVSDAGTATLRLHLTLTGIETSAPVLSTVTKVLPISLVANTVQTVRGKEGMFTGSVSFSVEIFDSATNRLLLAYVSKQFPWAEDVTASFGPLDAARAGIRNGADDLLTELAQAPNVRNRS